MKRAILLYFFRRLCLMFITLLIASIISFSLIHLTGADPIEIIAGHGATLEDINMLRAYYNLDKPIYVQYFIWLSRCLQGDFGISIRFRMPVSELILTRLPLTLSLSSIALFMSLPIAILSGIISAFKARTMIDKICMTFAILGISTPPFFIAIVLILVFSVYLQIIPISGQLILPAVALSGWVIGITARITRASTLEVLYSDFVLFLTAKGLGKFSILKHTLRNALIPIVTVISTQFAYMLAGSVIVETLFALPGVGALTLTCVIYRDIPVIQAIVLYICIIVMIINLVTDILYALIDPRIKVIE